MNPRAIKGNILIKMNIKQKESLALTDDITLEIQKGYNFNLREDRASFGYIIDGENLPKDAACLVHHLSIEPSYEVDKSILHYFITEDEIKKGFKAFRIPVDMCFCYRVAGGEWEPCDNFLITKRIFEPPLQPKGGIVLTDIANKPQRVKGRMYVVKGYDTEGGKEEDMSGLVLATTENCDYQIIWHEEDNKEYSLIRTRNRELILIDHDMTTLVKEKKLYVGLSENDCQFLN